MATVRHLARRTWLSIVDRHVSAEDIFMVREVLTETEFGLWTQMQAVDQRHSIRVFERFTVGLSDATRAECAAVLLHDVGKSVARLGTFARIAATLGLARGVRARSYREHEALGLELARKAEIDPGVLSLMAGVGRQEFVRAFASADNE